MLKTTSSLRTPWLLGGCLLWTVLAAVHGYAVVAGVEPKWDATALFSPYFMLIADYARDGQLLLWNPWSNAGSPDAAYVELGAYSPLTVFMAAVTGGDRVGF